MRLIIITLSALLVAGCSSEPELDPGSWTCQSLVDPIIKMSQERDPKIIEITHVHDQGKFPNEINCSGAAEWTRGEGGIEFGARVSDGGQVILEYRQR